jgi:hypothetical protein
MGLARALQKRRGRRDAVERAWRENCNVAAEKVRAFVSFRKSPP